MSHVTYDRLGIKAVINAGGRLTHLGGTTLSPDVAAAMQEAGFAAVELEKLKDAAGAFIAGLCGAEAGMICPGAAAGIAIMTAAVVAGDDPVRVKALPDAYWEKREILLYTGHAVAFGAPVTQMIRVGGGRPVLIGEANGVRAHDLRGNITPRTAAFLFVQSHHAVQKGMLPLADALVICRDAGVPVLVDAAAEEDHRKYAQMGCDGVTYSGGKAFGGPTSGLILGREWLIRACRAQEHGIARTMKVGKETILGLCTAMEHYVHMDVAKEKARLDSLCDELISGLKDLPHTKLSLIPDEAGRDIRRVGLTLDAAKLGFSAGDLAQALKEGSPAVVLRGHWANTGTVAIDPRPITGRDVPAIVQAIRRVYQDRKAL